MQSYIKVTCRTAWNWFKKGLISNYIKRTPSGRILIEIESTNKEKTKEDDVIYARVSSNDQKSTLASQIQIAKDYCDKHSIRIDKVITEIGSGLNGARPKFKNILENPNVTTIIATHRDRISRFGFEYIRSAALYSKKIILVDDNREVKNDIVKDVIDFMTSVCARLYSRRRTFV